MGLTIYYQGQLASESAYEGFVAAATAFAAARNWPAHPIAESSRQLTRTLQPEDPDEPEFEEVYTGATRGLYLLPHPECEPITFEFDRDLFMQDSTKTQFAGAAIHAAIVDLFRQAEPFFEMLDIQDEADFWETNDTEALARTFAQSRAAIDEAAAESPGSAIAVLTPSGRILDVLAAL